MLDTLATLCVQLAMFATTFPVAKPLGGYDDIWAGFDAITAAFSEDERLKLFRDNAWRHYRL